MHACAHRQASIGNGGAPAYWILVITLIPGLNNATSRTANAAHAGGHAPPACTARCARVSRRTDRAA
ncbi:hypothetical protein E4F39_26920 [Burkholderia pseudomallei]|nr:hypothetical protein [Burkholderia pseudomallei]MPT67567.1 hypothetical protein [Burkholderia pseudomallei]MPT74457.1 hypothetical protein [Burkholderia pseudomallei]MPT85526.1 hypothetical protein [Burkholderia pseudomallei]MPT91485.1 hypothetical protein [Burkholderia pseudomallei]